MNITLHLELRSITITNSFTLRSLENYCGNTGRITHYKIPDHLGKYVYMSADSSFQLGMERPFSNT